LSAGGPEERNLREQLAAARASLEKTVIRSEVAGTVLTRNAEPGDLVQPGRVLFDIARAGDTEIIVPFDEKNLSVLQVGQRATCIADAFPNNAFSAQITLIAPRIDPQRGTVDVRLKVQPVPEFLRQDMTVSVTVQTGVREHALAVPNDALMNIHGNEAYVLIAREGKAHRVPVRLGLRGLTLTEVVEGVRANDVVLVPGEQAVADGDRVRAVEGSAAGSNTQTEPQASSQS
jgi:HlyD family secretion protein